MSGMVCHFHADEWSPGKRLADGSYSHVCERVSGHPTEGVWHWLEVPEPPELQGLYGMAEELNLVQELPAAIAVLGSGWFEYGLVERSYAKRRPDDFAWMVAQWGHTSLPPKRYTVSSYLAGTLGRLSSMAAVAYHEGRGTGRWSYNRDISWWSSMPPGPWTERTAWVDVVGDVDKASHDADAECHSYVSGA